MVWKYNFNSIIKELCSSLSVENLLNTKFKLQNPLENIFCRCNFWAWNWNTWKFSVSVVNHVRVGIILLCIVGNKFALCFTNSFHFCKSNDMFKVHIKWKFLFLIAFNEVSMIQVDQEKERKYFKNASLFLKQQTSWLSESKIIWEKNNLEKLKSKWLANSW